MVMHRRTADLTERVANTAKLAVGTPIGAATTAADQRHLSVVGRNHEALAFLDWEAADVTTGRNAQRRDLRYALVKRNTPITDRKWATFRRYWSSVGRFGRVSYFSVWELAPASFLFVCRPLLRSIQLTAPPVALNSMLRGLLVS